MNSSVLSFQCLLKYAMDKAIIAKKFLQDTVVALQALAGFAALNPGASYLEQLSISLTADAFSYQYQTITDSNSLVLQSVQVYHLNSS
jgi:hypothetical protein